MSKSPITVWLIRRKKKLARGTATVYYGLKWPRSGFTGDGRQRMTTEWLGSCTKGEAEDARRQKIVDLTTGVTPIDRPDKITLPQFRDLYKERRARGDSAHSGRWHKKYPKLSSATLRDHDMTLRYLVAQFGEQRLLDTITEIEAELFIDSLAAGRLSTARQQTRREYGAVSEQTLRGHIRNAKTLWGWAVHFGLASGNPFQNFSGRPPRSEPKYHVSLDELECLLGACSSPGWRSLFALCRLAGLRREEARRLPWSGRMADVDGEPRTVGVDWEARKLFVVATKTGIYRVVPIVPRLYEVLLEAFNAAPEGQVSVTGLSGNNLTRNAQGFARAAGLAPWPSFYQSLRSSCENEWKQAGIAEPTYAAWLGHSAEISRKHYVSPTEQEFARVTSDG